MDGEEPAPWRSIIARPRALGDDCVLLSRRSETGIWRPRAILAFSDTLRVAYTGGTQTAAEAGIQTVVVTGDRPTTAATIARGAGLAGG